MGSRAKGAARRHAYLLVLSRYERGHRRFVELPDATVLAWFRRNWSRAPEERVFELKGDVYGLASVFDDASDEARPSAAPQSDAELVAEIDRILYSEGGHEVQAHFIGVQTDDDEYPIHYYFFDDDFLGQPGAWDELPDWRTGTALAEIEDEHPLDEDADDDEDEDSEDEGDDDDDERADAFERFYRKRNEE
jgi:hypothetical protein